MALDFPNAPVVNDTYYDSGAGITYKWNGTYWRATATIKLPIMNELTLAPVTYTGAGIYTFTHSLGFIPKIVRIKMKCIANDFNFAVGDTFFMHEFFANGAFGGGETMLHEETSLGSGVYNVMKWRIIWGIYLHDKVSAGAVAFMTANKWEMTPTIYW